MTTVPRKMRPSINFSFFLNFSDSPKPSTPIKSPRNFQDQVVGLAIVAAMNEIKGTHGAFPSVKTSIVAKIAVSAKSQPIPIVSSKPVATFRESSSSEKVLELRELPESYKCVISHLGNGISVRKREYWFDVVTPEVAINGDCERKKSGVFFASPTKNSKESSRVYQTADFLSSCYLCRKKLHGLDIFMYRGDQAFCSVECRCKQILNDDERKENCGSGALKSLDCSASPCSAPTTLFSTGAAAA